MALCAMESIDFKLLSNNPERNANKRDLSPLIGRELLPYFGTVEPSPLSPSNSEHSSTSPKVSVKKSGSNKFNKSNSKSSTNQNRHSPLPKDTLRSKIVVEEDHSHDLNKSLSPLDDITNTTKYDCFTAASSIKSSKNNIPIKNDVHIYTADELELQITMNSTSQQNTNTISNNNSTSNSIANASTTTISSNSFSTNMSTTSNSNSNTSSTSLNSVSNSTTNIVPKFISHSPRPTVLSSDSLISTKLIHVPQSSVPVKANLIKPSMLSSPSTSPPVSPSTPRENTSVQQLTTRISIPDFKLEKSLREQSPSQSMENRNPNTLMDSNNSIPILPSFEDDKHILNSSNSQYHKEFNSSIQATQVAYDKMMNALTEYQNSLRDYNDIKSKINTSVSTSNSFISESEKSRQRSASETSAILKETNNKSSMNILSMRKSVKLNKEEANTKNNISKNTENVDSSSSPVNNKKKDKNNKKQMSRTYLLGSLYSPPNGKQVPIPSMLKNVTHKK